jgi:hypothetical protein
MRRGYWQYRTNFGTFRIVPRMGSFHPFYLRPARRDRRMDLRGDDMTKRDQHDRDQSNWD